MRAVAAVAALASGAAALSEDYVRANAGAMFADFEREHGRRYAPGGERSSRLAIFTANMLRAARLDAEEPDATFGPNRFSDMSADEFRVYHTGFAPRPTRDGAVIEPLVGADEVRRVEATGIDWRKHGAVTGVKDQAQCGSCWAFSAIGAIEGAWYLAGNPLTSLSEQELVSCDRSMDGCGGGDMLQAIKWVKSNGGVNSEHAYPYRSGGGSTGSCDSSKEKVDVAFVSSVASIAHDEGQILAALQQYGPLSIGVDAGRFQSYSGGILSSCSAGQVDHGVLLVGYEASKKAWIVKNSWGKSWGESGYIRLQYGSNQCNMRSEVTKAHQKKADPVPPAAARFHCDNVMQRCTAAAAGHSSVGSCLSACGGGSLPTPKFHCDTLSHRCVAQAAGYDNVTACLAAC